MNLKQQIPPVNSKLNISDKFLRPDRISFIIDYPNIITSEQTITKGTTYALFISRDNNIAINMVQLKDAYWDGYAMSLIFKDMESKRNIHVEFDVFKEPSKYSWMLIDLPFLQENIDMLTVNNGCGHKFTWKQFNSFH